MSAAFGLQPSVRVVPDAVITGGVVSSVQVTVRDTGVAGLPQASVAFQVRVCERPQPLLLTAPSMKLGFTGPQLSVAVAEPSAASMSPAVGLQPSATGPGLPVSVITGGVLSSTNAVTLHVVPGSGQLSQTIFADTT